MLSDLQLVGPLLAQAVESAAEAAEAPLIPVWAGFLIVVVLFVLPFGLGALIARGLKLRDLSMKIGIVLFALELGLAPFVSQYVLGYFEHRRYEQQLARFEENDRRYQVTDEGLQQLKTTNPRLTIIPRKSSDTE